ncbi:MAG: bifunctional adenosylcobinamide kinase/adenosylcobinamide-phosphate guanylyltransferase [Oscillospiraceae bacterium]|nr:bifunctional adenosylcobinamide kinase/adenosylcobinamide-phosphate guanylyltransferase [Oscillospiraceae bacterium]
MMSLISGGSGSGKSAFAEQCVVKSAAAHRIYLATMEVWGEEDRQRVCRHREMRREKGFVTIEQTKNVQEVVFPSDSVLLLEDLSNLTANECFGGAGWEGAFERIFNGILSLNARAQDLVVVTNELFSDGIQYAEETAQYLDLLARLNRALAERADAVYEVVAGIPICWKGAQRELF